GPAPEPEGRLRVEGVRLSRLVEALGLGDRLRPLRGVVSFDVPFYHGPDRWPIGRGRFDVRDLRWQDAELSESLRGDVRLEEKSLRLRDVSGTLAGGLVRLQLSYPLGGR